MTIISAPFGVITEASTAEEVSAALGADRYRLPPQSVTARQAKSALLQAGWLGSTDEQVEANGYALFDAMPEPQRSLGRIAWRESNDFLRSNVWVIAMLQALGKTPQQGDDLFVAANKL